MIGGMRDLSKAIGVIALSIAVAYSLFTALRSTPQPPKVIHVQTVPAGFERGSKIIGNGIPCVESRGNDDCFLPVQE